MATSAIFLERSLTQSRPRAADGAQVRDYGAADVPAVAKLFNNAFRAQSGNNAQALESYLHELFLNHPWQDPELASKVFVGGDGQVEGFIGVLPLRMSLDGRPVRAAVASSLMVKDAEKNPLAGARLLRSFLSGPQTLSLSETSNPVAQRMWERLGGEALPMYSMEWLRVLAPAQFAVSMMRGMARPFGILQPLGAAIDTVLEKLGRNPLHLEAAPPTLDEDADPGDAALVDALMQLSANYSLRPDWDEEALSRFLQHAATKERHGVLVRRVVHGKRNVAVGCFLYYRRPGGVAFVLQVVARPDARDLVIDRLLNHTLRHGCIAVRGRATPAFQDALLRRKAIFLHRSSLTVYTRDSELLASVRAGDALVTGLAGESWTRLIGDSFV